MIKQISPDIVYVSGPKQSAIYNFSDGKVYSINKIGTDIINKYMSHYKLNEIENAFLTSIKEMFALSDIARDDYLFVTPNEKQLNFAWLELTQSCGNRCIHCYEGEKHVEASNPLSYNEWKKVLTELSKLGCKQIQFIGGEPTLYKGLPGLLNHARKVGMTGITVFTNLYEISDELIATIKKNSVKIHFSIYGSNAEVHDAITQVKGSFMKLLNNIKRLKDARVKADAYIIMMKENEHDRENIYALLKELDIVNIRCDEIRKVYGGCQEKHLVTRSLMNRTSPNFSCSKAYFDKAYCHNTCWYGKCVVSTDGSVYPCIFERVIKYGNIRETTLTNIIQSAIVDRYWYFDFSKVDTCKDCEFRFACKDCRPLAFAENGRLADKAARCTYNPYEGTW